MMIDLRRMMATGLLAGTAVVCGLTSPSLLEAKAQQKARSAVHTMTGTAVYYSDKMQGKPVSLKGEKYDSGALTAATHGQFPLGSYVKVTNLSNKKSVTVKVNDRMNPRSKSAIDLSRKAAEQIDLIHAGHARVRIEPTDKP